MSEMKIRSATAADITAITAIYSAAVRDGTASFELEPPDEAEMHRRWRTIVDGGFPYITASDAQGCVLGYAYLSYYRTRPAYRYSVENSIYVAHDAHRGGVGRALLTELINIADDKGFRQMIAVIGDPDQQAASIGLHRALGFAFCGTIQAVGFKHGRWLGSALMQLPLGEGDTTKPV